MGLKGRAFSHENQFNANGTISTGLPAKKLTTGPSKSLTKMRKSQTLRNKHHSGGSKTMKSLMGMVRLSLIHI